MNVIDDVTSTSLKTSCSEVAQEKHQHSKQVQSDVFGQIVVMRLF